MVVAERGGAAGHAAAVAAELLHEGHQDLLDDITAHLAQSGKLPPCLLRAGRAVPRHLPAAWCLQAWVRRLPAPRPACTSTHSACTHRPCRGAGAAGGCSAGAVPRQGVCCGAGRPAGRYSAQPEQWGRAPAKAAAIARASRSYGAEGLKLVGRGAEAGLGGDA